MARKKTKKKRKSNIAGTVFTTFAVIGVLSFAGLRELVHHMNDQQQQLDQTEYQGPDWDAINQPAFAEPFRGVENIGEDATRMQEKKRDPGKHRFDAIDKRLEEFRKRSKSRNGGKQRNPNGG